MRQAVEFLSTPPVWRATQPARRRIQQRLISIHALRAEGDAGLGSPVPARWVFLSTLSSRRATSTRPHLFLFPIISIHALLAESDRSPGHHRQSTHNFYPRSPRRERRTSSIIAMRLWIFLSTLYSRRATTVYDVFCTSIEFLSTLSSRRATLGWQVVFNGHLISIHALLAESDQISLAYRSNASAISIHALLAESDW